MTTGSSGTDSRVPSRRTGRQRGTGIARGFLQRDWGSSSCSSTPNPDCDKAGEERFAMRTFHGHDIYLVFDQMANGRLLEHDLRRGVLGIG